MFDPRGGHLFDGNMILYVYIYIYISTHTHTHTHTHTMFKWEGRLLLSWARAGKDSKGRSKATRSEGDDLEESAARALMHHGGRGRGGRG